jgi:hypothetical protein
MKEEQKQKLEIAKKNGRAIDGIICDAIDAKFDKDRFALFRKTFEFEGCKFSFLDLVVADAFCKGREIKNENISYFASHAIKSDLLNEEQILVFEKSFPKRAPGTSLTNIDLTKLHPPSINIIPPTP